MKTKCSLLMVILLICAHLAFGQDTSPNSAPQPVIKIELTAVKQAVEIGKPVRVIVYMKNTSGKDLDWPEVLFYKCEESEDNPPKKSCHPHTGRLFRFLVTDAQGNAVERTDFHKDIFGERGRTAEGWTWSFPITSLPANMVSEYHVDLAKLYKFSLPGTYTVQVERRQFDDPKGLLVKSDPVTITLTK
jgi:hypothetical protein